MINRIITGGLPGAERAALDVAVCEGIDYAGWCPAGQGAEDGAIDTCNKLKEAPQDIPNNHLRLNVQDSDGTLILTMGDLDGTTLLLMGLAVLSNKSFMLVQLDRAGRRKIAERVKAWISDNNLEALNIAGPMETAQTGIYENSKWFVTRLLADTEKLALIDEADEKKHRLSLAMLNADLGRLDDDDESVLKRQPIRLDDLPLKLVRRDRSNQTSSSDIAPDVVYVVMPDVGLVEWIGETTPDGNIAYGGGNAIDAGDWVGKKSISEDLGYAIKLWVGKIYNLEEHHDQGSKSKTLEDLRARGRVIAKQLKSELGRKAKVVYIGSQEGNDETGSDAWEIVRGGAMHYVQNFEYLG